MRFLICLLLLMSAQTLAQDTVPKEQGEGFERCRWRSYSNTSTFVNFYPDSPVADPLQCGNEISARLPNRLKNPRVISLISETGAEIEWDRCPYIESQCESRPELFDTTYSSPVYLYDPVTVLECPESHPIDNGDGTCSKPPPELPEDCPIGTKLSIGLGQLGDGSPPVCEPFSCPVGGANVTIPTQFFEVDFGSPSFAFCDGSCAYTVSTGSGGSVNAYASGLACGNGTAEYVYAAPTFDSEFCTGGDNWVDCSADPERVDEDNPITSYDPVSPEDIDVPLEEEPDFTPEPLPDCTAETALSGGCFVNSMDAVQTNISGSISTSQSQQTDRVVKSITALINSNREGMTGLGDKLAKTIEESRRASALPFLTQQFAGVENPEPEALTLQEAATGLDFDADGWNYSDLIPTATKTLGWNPTDYQFGVGGGLCPEPTVLVIGGQNISLDWSMFCDMAVIINAFLIAMAYFIGGNIIMRAF